MGHRGRAAGASRSPGPDRLPCPASRSGPCQGLDASGSFATGNFGTNTGNFGTPDGQNPTVLHSSFSKSSRAICGGASVSMVATLPARSAYSPGPSIQQRTESSSPGPSIVVAAHTYGGVHPISSSRSPGPASHSPGPQLDHTFGVSTCNSGRKRAAVSLRSLVGGKGSRSRPASQCPPPPIIN